MTIHVLHIEHKYGHTMSAHSTELKALKMLSAYVKENWDDAGPGSWDEPMPADDDDAIEMYFHENDREFRNIEQLEVDA